MAKQDRLKSANVGELRFSEVKNEDGTTTRVPRVVVDSSIQLMRGTWNPQKKEYENFKPLDLGTFKTLKCIKPEMGLESLLKNKKITQSKYEEEMRRLEEKNVGYKIVFFPPEE